MPCGIVMIYNGLHYIFHQVCMSQSEHRSLLLQLRTRTEKTLFRSHLKNPPCWEWDIYNWACAMKCELFSPPFHMFLKQSPHTVAPTDYWTLQSFFYSISIFWTSSRYALTSEYFLEQHNTNVVQKVVLGFKWLKILFIYWGKTTFRLAACWQKLFRLSLSTIIWFIRQNYKRNPSDNRSSVVERVNLI